MSYIQCVVEKEYVSFVYFYKQLEIEYLTINDANTNVKEKEKDKAIEKIKKLLALAQSDNEAEAISASLMAQKLLAKNHLTMHDIDGTHGEEEPVEDCYFVTDEGKDKFKYDLASIVADNFCCKTYFKAHYIHFRGYRVDIIAARNCYGFLYNSAKKLGHARERAVRKRGFSATGVYDSFVDGFLSAIQTELSKQCTALMLVTPEKVLEEWKTFKEESGMKEKDLSRNSAVNYDAWVAGNKEGKKIFNSQYLDDSQHYIGRKEN